MPDQMLIGAEVYNYGYETELEAVLNGQIDGEDMGATISYLGDTDEMGNELYNGLEADSSAAQTTKDSRMSATSHVAARTKPSRPPLPVKPVVEP